MRRALLFDLDETLVEEERAAVAAFEATARFAAARHGLDAAAIVRTARSSARALWEAGPVYDYCGRAGISSTEGLWCRFEGDEPNMPLLRDWSAIYRRDVWSSALGSQGVDDTGFAEQLGHRFAKERRARHGVFADVLPSLNNLSKSYVLALVTNGASCLQREKLVASRLADYFEVVVVSSEFGVGKPDASIFRHTLSQIGVTLNCAVMIGDSIARDIDGAKAAGLQAMWVNRFARSRPADRHELLEIATLNELPSALAGLRRDRASSRSHGDAPSEADRRGRPSSVGA